MNNPAIAARRTLRRRRDLDLAERHLLFVHRPPAASANLPFLVGHCCLSRLISHCAADIQNRRRVSVIVMWRMRALLRSFQSRLGRRCISYPRRRTRGTRVSGPTWARRRGSRLGYAGKRARS